MHGSSPSWAPVALPKGGELVGSGQGEAITYPCIHAHTDSSASVWEGGIFCCLGRMSQSLGGGLCWTLHTHFCGVGVLLAVSGWAGCCRHIFT